VLEVLFFFKATKLRTILSCGHPSVTRCLDKRGSTEHDCSYCNSSRHSSV